MLNTYTQYVLQIAVILACSYISPLSAQPKNCANPTSPEARTNGDQKTLKIEWIADADLVDEEDDEFQMTRIVINRDSQTRMIRWPIARIRVVSLDPNQWALYCPPADEGRNIEPGPIYFRMNKTSEPTTVYENYREDTGIVTRPPEGTLRFTTRFNIGSKQDIDNNQFMGIIAETSLSYSHGRYAISYDLENTGSIPYKIQFDERLNSLLEEYQKPLALFQPNEAIVIEYSFEGRLKLDWIPLDLFTENELHIAQIDIFGPSPSFDQ